MQRIHKNCSFFLELLSGLLLLTKIDVVRRGVAVISREVCQQMAEAQIDAFRRGEYYGERRQYIPDNSEVIGQDLVNRQLLADEPAGLARDGFSSANDLALVDHREFASSEDFPDIFTEQVRKLAGSGLNRARSVDNALKRAETDSRKAVESNLIIFATQCWQIRTGEVACTYISDAISNTMRILQRLDFCRTLTLEAVRVEASKTLILEYYAYLERYYVRQFSQPLREQMFEKFGQLQAIWNTSRSLWHAIPVQMQGTGTYTNIQRRERVTLRYTSISRSRSRSPRED